LTLTMEVKLAQALGVQIVDLLAPPKGPRKKARRGRPRKT
jgi:hypothetical protein